MIKYKGQTLSIFLAASRYSYGADEHFYDWIDKKWDFSGFLLSSIEFLTKSTHETDFRSNAQIEVPRALNPGKYLKIYRNYEKLDFFNKHKFGKAYTK